jgi:hypothetical protein
LQINAYHGMMWTLISQSTTISLYQLMVPTCLLWWTWFFMFTNSQQYEHFKTLAYRKGNGKQHQA